MPPLTKKLNKPVVPPRGIVLPTEPVQRGVKLSDYITVVFGAPGVGKTTFVNQFGRVLFISTDRGTRFMPTMSVECQTWAAFEQILSALEQQASNPQYDFICIDHVADWGNMAEMAVLQQLNISALADAGYGKGWSELKKKINHAILRIKRINAGLVFIAHEEIKSTKVAGIEIDKVMPMMSKQVWAALIPLCDLVAYVGMKPMLDPVTKKRSLIRVFETQPREDLYAKDRTRRNRPVDKPYEVLDGKKFIATFPVA